MIDLHTHSLLSDGDLLPAELIQRAYVAGYQAIGITDHVDSGNMEEVITRITKVCRDIRHHSGIIPIAGVELTHVPPQMVPELAKGARELGAKLVIVHGETVVEPVPPGTNRAGLLSEIDILAHPGLITEEDVQLAREQGIYLEISARKGHCLTNGHLVRLAREIGALSLLVLSSDAHSPGDLLSEERQRLVGLGAGLSPKELKRVIENKKRLLERVK